jgi:hypothetical protein
MNRVRQEGDCLAACLAAILEVPLDEVPSVSDDRIGAWRSWLQERGWDMMMISGTTAEVWKPAGLWIAIQQRDEFDTPHAVVWEADKVVHDPAFGAHRENWEDVEVVTGLVLVPLDPAHCLTPTPCLSPIMTKPMTQVNTEGVWVSAKPCLDCRRVCYPKQGRCPDCFQRRQKRDSIPRQRDASGNTAATRSVGAGSGS